MSNPVKLFYPRTIIKKLIATILPLIAFRWIVGVLCMEIRCACVLQNNIAHYVNEITVYLFRYIIAVFRLIAKVQCLIAQDPIPLR